ncbi:Uncharacterised protein [Mycobacteroides abscessus subsp. abscessus]|nr:Uncharacterised protein [Mycobacteroides abscessus subsp. abscessus]
MRHDDLVAATAFQDIAHRVVNALRENDFRLRTANPFIVGHPLAHRGRRHKPLIKPLLRPATGLPVRLLAQSHIDNGRDTQGVADRVGRVRRTNQIRGVHLNLAAAGNAGAQ